MNMSKCLRLPNFELIPSKMAKLQCLEKYLLGRHTDVIEALNLELYKFWKTYVKIPQLTKFVLFILKNRKVTRPFMFSIMTSL